MKKPSKKTLNLALTTVRALDSGELADVNGGALRSDVRTGCCLPPTYAVTCASCLAC